MQCLIRFAVAIVLLLSVEFVSSASAQDSPAVMLVLDASGSMWGQIEGKAKIQIAREVIAELLQTWDGNTALGLTVYGHRRKGDCGDIEVLIPLGTGTADAVRVAVGSISPKGKTPLSEAVRQAAVAVGYTEQPATVILVSDGIETCDADPCAVGAELGMTGVDFTAHVVGFDLKDEEQLALRCLAENTGGLFLAAADAGELRNALSQAVAEVKEPSAPVVEDPGEASLDGPTEVPAGSTFEVIWEGPDSRRDFIAVAEKDAPEGSYVTYAYTADGSPVSIVAPDEPKAYELRYVFKATRATLARADITATPVEASVKAPAETAAGSTIEVAWTGPNNPRDYITVVPADAEKHVRAGYAYTENGSPAAVRIPDTEGDYEVRYISKQSKRILAKAAIKVTGVSGSVSVPTVVPVGAEIEVTWTGPDYPKDFITVVTPDTSENNYGKLTYTKEGSPLMLTAPGKPGTYEVRYLLGQSRTVLAKTTVTVAPLTIVLDAPASVSAGESFEVIWEGPAYRKDFITIVPANAAEAVYENYSKVSEGSPAKLKAPDKTGAYEVRYLLNSSRTVAGRVPIEVK
jgi:Ca-activated chloride channel family protein